MVQCMEQRRILKGREVMEGTNLANDLIISGKIDRKGVAFGLGAIIEGHDAPLVRDWMIEYRNPVAQLSGHAETALAAAGRLPSMLEEAESALKDLNAEMNRRRSAGSVWLGFALAVVVGAGLMWLVLQATGG